MFVALLAIALVAACTAERDDNIIGGQEAAVGAYPYQCSLQRYNQHICGCSIISDRWIISAAHCFDPRGMPDSVVVGLHDLYDGSVGEPQRHSFTRIITHSGFNSFTLSDDIAVAATNTIIDLSSPYVSTIPLAASGADYQNSQGVISGWGYTDGMRSPSRLQAATVNVFPNSHCSQYWGGTFKSSGMVCLGEVGSKGACMGDSGGPLQVNGVLVGLTSYGPGDCNTYMPSVYTRVAGYRSWILTNTGL